MHLPIGHRVILLLLFLAGCSIFSSSPASENPSPTLPGAAIFQDKCANCHGIDGQGVAEKYDEPLAGNRTLSSLARYIERAMPDEEPETCVGEEARQVAEYVFNEFYSLEARRKKGMLPRIELARLTVPQYRNAVADLVGLFTPQPNSRAATGRENGSEGSSAQTEPGLHGTYYQSKGMSKADQLRLERIDREIDFNFGEGSPEESITADQFTVIWSGALIAADTGDYEFRVRTENGARLYINSEDTGRGGKLRDDSSAAGQSALIDAWVGSGDLREQTARVYLLGGRLYPLRLEFFKYKEKTASIRLEWKPPNGTWALLNHRHANTAIVPRTFVVETPFPADDRSLGYERGSSVSRAWEAAIMNAAIATASEVVNRLPKLARFEQGTPERLPKIKEFIAQFAHYAYRRPLTKDEDQLFREVLFSGAATPETAARRAVLLILKSPHFLYPDLTPENHIPNQHTIASRLSLALWDSMPDKILMKAADQSQLTTSGQIEEQAWRMISDPRAKAKIRSFFHAWLELDERDLAKDKNMFPQFDETVIADLRYSLDLFVDRVVWSDRSDYRELLQADYLILNDRLHGLYGSDENNSGSAQAASSSEPFGEFVQVVFPTTQRAGILTHPYLLSAFAYHNNTSPIHRGVFLTRNIIGRRLKPPPIAVAFKNEEFAPDSTMREKITQLTRDKACISCHSIINPLGFALENYDAVGRWRTREKDKPVDSRSEYVTADGSTVELQNARDIADFAVTNESAHRAFVSQLFHHLVKQQEAAYGPKTEDQLRSRFEEDHFNIQNLVIDIATLMAVHGQTPNPQHPLSP